MPLNKKNIIFVKKWCSCATRLSGAENDREIADQSNKFLFAMSVLQSAFKSNGLFDVRLMHRSEFLQAVSLTCLSQLDPLFFPL